MFYKLPQVRAISRYADFSSHLGRRSFFSMIGLAVFLHACAIGIIAMMPHSPVVRIPVRVLNFNLGAVSMPQSGQQPVPDQNASAQAVAAPKVTITREDPPAGSEEDSTANESENAQNELEKALAS